MRPSAALINALAPAHPDLDTAARAAVAAETREFVAAELAGAPWHIRTALGLLGLVTLFAAWLLAPGRGLGRQAPSTRNRVLRRLEKPGTPSAAYLRALRSLIALAWLDHPLVLGALGVETGANRQAHSRGVRAAHGSEV